MLYVFDPTAMHTIVVKDQYIFEETRWFIKYVCHAPVILPLVLTSRTLRFNILRFGPGLLAKVGECMTVIVLAV